MATPHAKRNTAKDGYELHVCDSFFAELDRAPGKVHNAWEKTIAKRLRKNPTDTGTDVIKRLKYYKHLWRYRVGNDWRLVYKMDEGQRVVTCLMIGMRDKGV